MIKILETSTELTKVQKYLMTTSPAIKSVKDLADGEGVKVVASLTFQDIKDDGEEVEIFSILDENGVAYATNSKTFKRAFLDIVEAMDGEYPIPILKSSGVSNAGRQFVQCELDVASL